MGNVCTALDAAEDVSARRAWQPAQSAAHGDSMPVESAAATERGDAAMAGPLRVQLASRQREWALPALVQANPYVAVSVLNDPRFDAEAIIDVPATNVRRSIGCNLLLCRV